EESRVCTPATPCGLNDNWSLSWNGSRIHFQQGDIAFGYTEFMYEVVAAGPVSTLSFSISNEPGFYRLDDVSVTAVPTAVPEPASVFLLGTGVAALLRRRRISTSS